MTGKILGAILIVVGCGGFGFILSAASRAEEKELRHLIAALDYMQCELHYRLTPLPDLCHLAGSEQKGSVGSFFRSLSVELESQVSPDVASCVRAALTKAEPMSGKVLEALQLLGSSMGRFDAEGQLQGLEYVRDHCREMLNRMSVNREARLRSYQTLGLCAGAALAILFV